MTQSTAEQLRRRDKSKVAVNLAIERKWDEAVAVNKEILEESPDNIEALNRLGKAHSELGRYTDAREAFQKVLRLMPSNTIAKKNLDRIALLRDADAGPKPVAAVAPAHFFIEETGKTGSTTLTEAAPPATVAKLTAGEIVILEAQDHGLVVKNYAGEYLGTVEPKLGLRLLRLIQGGNRYEAAIASVQDQAIRVLIRETYQHPGQQGKLSFPPSKGGDNFRGYVWEGAGRFVAEDEDEPAAEAEDSTDDESADGEEVAAFKRRPRARKALDEEESEEEEA
jgi:tetratricopeptide (TPR) repeat protein